MEEPAELLFAAVMSSSCGFSPLILVQLGNYTCKWSAFEVSLGCVCIGEVEQVAVRITGIEGTSA